MASSAPCLMASAALRAHEWCLFLSGQSVRARRPHRGGSLTDPMACLSRLKVLQSRGVSAIVPPSLPPLLR